MREKRFLLKRRLDDKVVCDLDGLPIVFESDEQVLEEPALLKKNGIYIEAKMTWDFMTAAMIFTIKFLSQMMKTQS